MNEELLIQIIKQNLTNDLIQNKKKLNKHPMFGFCGVASVVFWLCTGKKYKLMTGIVCGESHTWVEDGNRIIDITVDQFKFHNQCVSYEHKQEYITKYKLNLKNSRYKKLLRKVISDYKKFINY